MLFRRGHIASTNTTDCVNSLWIACAAVKKRRESIHASTLHANPPAENLRIGRDGAQQSVASSGWFPHAAGGEVAEVAFHDSLGG